MVESWTASPDGMAWTFKLRPGLKFNDGTPVTAEDCIASLQRWAKKDTMGQALMAAGAELAATGPDSFSLTLKQPFGLVLDALAKPSGMPPFIMPKRLAMTDPNTPVTEMVGSGPFLFKRDEWVPGNKVVYVKNPAYVPRNEPADGLAGGKVAKVDRIEWIYIPDGNTATAALMNGEVDMIEQTTPIITRRSSHLPAFQAASTPSGNAASTANSMVKMAIDRVGPMRWPINCATGIWVAIEVPRSPVARCPTQMPNCASSGLSRPRFWRIFSTSSVVALSPAITAAGSPGDRCISRNTTTATTAMTGITAAMRRRMNFTLGFPPA